MTKPTIRARDLFERLEPRPGGLAALRRRLDGDEARRSRGLRVAAVAAVAAAVAVLLVVWMWPTATWPPRARASTRLAAHPAAVGLGFAPAPAEPVTVMPGSRAEVAVSRVPTSDERVVFYWVATADTPADDPAPTP